VNKCERMNFRCAKSKNNDHRVRYGAFPRAAKMLFDRTVSKTKFCVWTNISVQSAAVKWKQDSSRVEALIIQNGMIGWLARPKSRFGLEQKCAVRNFQITSYRCRNCGYLELYAGGS
jgi:hypothetical protein